MLHRVSAVSALILGGIVLGAPIATVRAQGVAGMSEAPMPGGLRDAAAAINARTSPSRTHFLSDVIRRSFEAPVAVKGLRREALLQPLMSHLDRGGPAGGDTVPLPLTADIWITAVFAGKATPQTLIAEILRAPGASLLYSSLLTLDGPTRGWIAEQPELLAQLAAEHAATFIVAAPAFRVAGGAAVLPGGQAALPIWEALAGHTPTQPREFLKALLTQRQGRVAYFAGALAQLGPAQVQLALNLDASDAAARIATSRRLFSLFEKVASNWSLAERPFWRPTLDPALLLAELPVAADGRPVVPGTQAFWNEVFADSEPAWTKSERDELPDRIADAAPADFVWLCEQVFTGGQIHQRQPYQQVLLASRLSPRITRANARDAVVTVRAVDRFPALVSALERVGLEDLSAYAHAAKRAARLSATRSRAAIAQFQGALTFVARTASRSGAAPEALARAVTALASLEANERGDYEGRLVRWFAGWIDTLDREIEDDGPQTAADPGHRSQAYHDAVGPFDRKALRVLAGAAGRQRQSFEWEGTRYRLDFTAAEAIRLTTLLGDGARPYLASARALVDAADALGAAALTKDTVRTQATLVEDAIRTVRADGEDVWPDDMPRQARDVVSALQRAGRNGDIQGSARLAAPLRLLADDLGARGLLELAYAAALGHPESLPISAGDAASRHDFGFDSPGGDREGPWRPGIAGADRTHNWHVTGSLLGLDVRLATLSLVRLSAKPPARPVLNDEDRRVLIEAVPLVQPWRLIDEHRDVLVSAIRTGRAAVAALQRQGDADAIAGRLGLGPVRRTLFAWTLEHDRARAPDFLSPTELLWLGLGDGPAPAWLDAWGAPAEARNGCVCLQFIGRRSTDAFDGRWYSGIFASTFGDLNLRLTELLAELKMPAPLLAAVLGPATWDFVSSVTPQHLDDRRSLVLFVQALPLDRIEQYLALLTTDGPLVPVSAAGSHPLPPGRPQ